jgi:hypothetical protein
MRRLLMFITISLFSLSGLSAQTTTLSWKVSKVESIQHWVGESYFEDAFPVLSPDGSALVWSEGDSGLRIFTFADEQVTTYPWPDEFGEHYSQYSTPSWSPDSQHFAFIEDPYYSLDTDIWMLDRADGKFTNRTDDGIGSQVIKPDRPFTRDYLPTWNPVNGDLYFFRTPSPIDKNSATELYLLPIGRDEPKLVYDLTPDVAVFSIYRPAVISPDGRRIAFMVRVQGLSDPRNGVWVLDLKTGKPQQVASIEDLLKGLPPVQQESAVLFTEALFWAGSDALIIYALDQTYVSEGSVRQITAYVDLIANSVTPLSDFSHIDDLNLMLETDSPDSPVFRIPRTGVVSPDGHTFFFLRYGPNEEHAGISALALPPDGSPPVELVDIEGPGFGRGPFAPAVMGSNGRALFGGYVLEFEQS